MKRFLLTSAVFIALSVPADAATIGVRGVTTQVAQGAQNALQCVLNALVARGYPVKFIRGYGKGSVRGSLHPSGYALDVNQLRRGVTVPRMPRDEVQLAASCGAISGAVWRNNDSGHFQVGGWGGRHMPRHMHRRHHR